MNYLGEKPSSRILRPPGGESSNIFGEFDNIPVEKKNPKPTYQSSVFSGDPEPVLTKPAAQSGHLSNNIFGTDDDTNYTAKTPNKDSKTRASILFQVSEPSTKIDEAVVDHHISNIPMFSTNTLEEPKRAKKRPVTAPAQKQRSSFNLFANAEHAVDTRPGPGERTKTSTDGDNYFARSPSSFDTGHMTTPRQKHKKHLQSTIFQPLEEVARPCLTRRNPITGEGIEIEVFVRGKRPAMNQTGEAVDSHEPRLGPIKNVTGMRCYKWNHASGNSLFSVY